MKKTRFIKFEKALPHPNEYFLIYNKLSDKVLGHIMWHGPLGQYVAIFQEGTVWPHNCLSEVSKYLKSLPKRNV